MVSISNPCSRYDKAIVFFRLDSSAEIGGGHLYRCLTLAHQLEKQKFEIIFICRKLTGDLGEVIVKQGYQLKYLDLEKNSEFYLDADAECTATIIENNSHTHNSILLITDHYLLSGPWYDCVGSLVNVSLVIDDLANRPLPADMVIDTGLSKERCDYEPWIASQTTLLLGPKYALLNSSFGHYRQQLIQQDSAKIKNILIFFGSTDPKQQILLTLNAIKSWPLRNKFNWTVLVSEHASHFQAVKRQLSRELPTIRLTSFETDMASFLSQFQLVIGANGINAFERCCLGIPAITMNAADNQQENSLTLSQANAIVHIDDTNISPVPRLLSSLEAVTRSAERYQWLRNNALKVCDEKGSQRILGELNKKQDKAKLVLATSQHMILLFNWQLDDDTRKFSRNPEPPTLDEHKKWYQATLIDPNKQLYFVEQHGIMVAMVRVDFTSAHGQYENEISIIVNPESRKRGIGQLALSLIRQRYNHLTLSAYIQDQHTSSIKLFTLCGYQKAADNWYINPPRQANKTNETSHHK